MKYVCECGWRPEPGAFIEVNMSPEELERMDLKALAPYVETDHFLRQGCRGRVEPELEAGEG